MGIEHVVRFPRGTVPPLSQVIALLAEHNSPVQLRMVDGQLTLPGEVPPDRWREVRLGTSGGMVTLTRRGEELAVVIWGNADSPMQSAWNAVAWGVAQAGQGKIVRRGGLLEPSEFRVSVPMPDSMRH